MHNNTGNFILKLYLAISNKLNEAKGEWYIDSAVKVLIVVILGAMLIGSLILLFNNIVLPKMETKIEGLFDSVPSVNPSSYTST